MKGQKHLGLKDYQNITQSMGTPRPEAMWSLVFLIWSWEGMEGSSGGLGGLDRGQSEPCLDAQVLGLPEAGTMSTGEAEHLARGGREARGSQGKLIPLS